MVIYLGIINFEVNNQNLYGYQPTQDNINLISGGTGSYQSLAANEQVVTPNGAGVDLNYQGIQGGSILALKPLNVLPDPEPRLILLTFLSP